MTPLKRNIKVEGSTTEEAIKKAMDRLRISRDDISVRVVSEEQKGLFGMQGAKPAKIIVSVKKNKKNVV